MSTCIQDILKATNTSKGGFYNHFRTKEDLFVQALDEARKIWRERNLSGLDEIEKPLEKTKKLQIIYRDRYLKDADHFPGVCGFVTLSVELGEQRPHPARELNEGYARLRSVIDKLLCQAQEADQLSAEVDHEALTEMIFSGMLGVSVMYGMDRSAANLDRTINSLIEHLDRLTAQKPLAMR